MAEEKKKPWQFSLGRMLGAMTIVCITLGMWRLIAITDFIDEPGGEYSLTFGWGMFPLMGFGAAVGFLVGLRNSAFLGAIFGMLLGQIVFSGLLMIAILSGFLP